MTQLMDAVLAAEQRIASANHDDAAGDSPGLATKTIADVAVLFLGFDLDVEELGNIAQQMAVATIMNTAEGVAPPDQLIAGSWMHGVLTGLILAEMRRLA